ncbi:MAG: hypothetical protein ACO1SX_09370, partial [Actinomycetota bacterium]
MISTAHTRTIAVAAVLLIGAMLPAEGQDAPQKPGSVFKELIKQPTGKNGYEELILAAEVLKTSKLFEKATLGSPTLSDKRLVLSDRPVVRALALIRQGLSKPVVSTRQSISPNEIPSELTLLRGLARLLAMQQYVQLADGRTAEAIGTARVGMRLGQVIQQDSLLGGLIGVAVGATCIRSLAAHLDQLSARDCDLLRDVCLEWLNYPDPLPHVLEAERKVVQNAIEQLKKDNPGDATNGLFADTPKVANEFFDRLIAETRSQPWERKGVNVANAPDFARALLAPLAASLEHSMNAYTREEANVRQLAVHALILRCRWDTDKLPTSLTDLNPGDLAIDP